MTTMNELAKSYEGGAAAADAARREAISGMEGTMRSTSLTCVCVGFAQSLMSVVWPVALSLSPLCP